MVYWSPGYIKYTSGVKDILENALQGEYTAIKKYRMQCERIRDCHVVEILKRIILDEELHVKILKKLLQECS